MAQGQTPAARGEAAATPQPIEITRWRIAAWLDTSSKEPVASFPYRHGPQGYVPGRGWISVGNNDGRPLTFETAQLAQDWIDARVKADAAAGVRS